MATIALALSVLSALALSILILREGSSHFEKEPSWRGLALAMAIVNSLLLVLVTELLGALGRLEFGWVLAAWVLLGTVQIPYWRRIVKKLRDSRARAAPLSWIEIALIVPVVAIVLCTGVIALASAPNTWDALTYHLTRVAHWKQNGSVEFFPTWIERQLSFPPFAEYAMLHLQILTGGDRFAALVQWLSFIGTLVGVALIAAEFGVNRLGQLVAVLFAATLPIAILEASSTQNDLVVSFWLVCFCLFSIQFAARRSRLDAAAASGALGLALLTKPTAYLLVPAFALGFLILGLRRHGVRLLPVTLGGLILGLGVPAAFYARNLNSYGEPVGSAVGRASHLNRTTRLTPLISNLLRGAALHAGAPPLRLRLPQRAQAAVESIERRMPGSESLRPLDAPEDWRYTLSREDRAGAPLHFLAVLATLAALGIGSRAWRIPPPAAWLVLGLVVGVVVLARFVVWNHFMVRFHMNLFFLAAPLVGLVAMRMKRYLVVGASALLVLGSVYPLIQNQLRPLFGPESIFHTSRRDQYFRTGAKRNNVLATIDYLNTRQDTVIGLRIVKVTPEYPFWILLPAVAAGRARVCHVNVSNPSRSLQSEEDCRPTAIVSDKADAEAMTVNAVPYTRRWRDGDFGVYLPAR